MKRNIFRLIILSVLAVVCFVIPGCTVGPDYETPCVGVPDNWQSMDADSKAGEVCLSQWWCGFNDPVLNSLMTRCNDNNKDIRQAIWRIEEARALRDFAVGEYYPDVNGGGFYDRNRASENGLTPNNTDHTNLNNVGVDAAWEIDLFGKIKRSVESAEASYQAQVENYRDTLVLLYSEVAKNYIDLRTAQARIEYAVANAELQRKTLKLTEDRFEAEIAPELDVTQARSNLARTESEIPLFRITERQAIHRLAVLIGVYPADLYDELSKPGDLPVLNSDLMKTIPADILRQRPDVRFAERTLAAQTARIGVATAELYPILTLNGTFALEATNIGDIGNIHSRTYGFGPSFTWNLFDGDRVKNLIKAEKSSAEGLVYNYEKSILVAVQDVEDAVVGYEQQKERTAALERSVDAAKKSVELVETLYRNGLTDFQNVLDMQRTLTTQQDSFAQSSGDILQNVILYYKALGGGWLEELPQLPCERICVKELESSKDKKKKK